MLTDNDVNFHVVAIVKAPVRQVPDVVAEQSYTRGSHALFHVFLAISHRSACIYVNINTYRVMNKDGTQNNL